MRSHELKKCPFCGETVDFGVATDCIDESSKSCDFICDKCGAVVSFADSSDFAEEKQEEMKRKAIRAWNKRTENTDNDACPFCGGMVHYEIFPAEFEYDNDECDVICDNCGMAVNFYAGIDGKAKVRDETERLWRSRSHG